MLANLLNYPSFPSHYESKLSIEEEEFIDIDVISYKSFNKCNVINMLFGKIANVESNTKLVSTSYVIFLSLKECQ